MSETIYLVGQISPKIDETYKWREKVRKEFENDSSINIIDPCANPFNEKVLERKEYAVTKEKRSFGLDLLVPKDYLYVKRSSIGIINMNHYDLDKPMIGSFFELAWYYSMPGKAVIAFADDLDDYNCQHPFVQQAVTTWCRDVGEACYLIRKYFIDTLC